MPAALTHHILALRALESLPDVRPEPFLLGAQGPDPFFYYATLPWGENSGKERINAVGERLHHTDVSVPYSTIYERGDEDGRSLVKGLWLHYCLDRLAHPYVFYRSGFDAEGKLVGYYKFAHGKLEAYIDKLLAKREGQYRNPGRLFDFSSEELERFSILFEGIEGAEARDYLASVNAFCRTERFLFCRTGAKRILFRLVGKYSLAYGMSYPASLRQAKELDVLNLSHSTWKVPESGEERTDSFPELLDQALLDYLRIYPLIDHNDVEGLSRFVDRTDHDGCHFGKTMRHCDVAFGNMEAGYEGKRG